MNKYNLYVLKNNIKNPNWELRNRDVRIPRYDDKGNLLGLREIQFVKGASSIWKEDNEKEGTPSSIWFKEGSISVPVNDKIQVNFVESHPEFSVKFEKFDPESQAADEYAKFELAEKATELLRENADDEDKLAAVAASLFGATAMNWGAKQTKMRCFVFAKEKPQEVIDALNDPASHSHYVAAVGFRKQIITTNPQKTAVVWNDADRGIICQVPAGQKALKVLGEFLFDEKNLVTLQKIGDMIDSYNPRKPKNKAKAKKAA